MYFILLYDYVDDIAERRTPYREEHLALIRALVADGSIMLAGAYTDPLDGAAFVFKSDNQAVVEHFINNDPYVAAGLVTGWRIRQWTVVAGTAA